MQFVKYVLTLFCFSLKNTSKDSWIKFNIWLTILGTTERVCIISGASSDHIMAALTFIMERIREKPDASNRVQNSGDAIADREKQVGGSNNNIIITNG